MTHNTQNAKSIDPYKFEIHKATENTICVPPRVCESKNYLPKVSQILLKLVNK
jgi:hypothetical protein